MEKLSLYIDKNTIIHKISPISKLYYILTSILVPIIKPDFKIIIFATLCSIFILIIGKVFKHTLKLFAFNIILIISIIIIQGMFNPNNKELLLKFGILSFYKEGLMLSIKIILRLLNIISSFSILIFTVKPSELIENLVYRGFSPKIGYILSSVLLIIPSMIKTTDTIINAQKSRGLETEGRLINRIKAFFPLIGPVILSSLINTRERAMALEVRGFNSNSNKTFLIEYKSYWYDRLTKFLSIFLIIISILWRIVYG